MAEFKVFNDPVHGHMIFHPLFVNIIDTPQFQRMRNIKQTNSLYYVFPGSSHNRFEHSLGTCFIAVEFINSIRKNQPELNITDSDVLCIGIAGLCHDLGHGPLSHLWETYINHFDEKADWKHEEASISMLDYLICANSLKEAFAEYGLYDEEISLIKDLIIGKRRYTSISSDQQQLQKNFMFEIIANRRCGVDVDKWEYLLRDSYHLGLRCNFDYQRLILYARVINIDGEGPQICIRDKEVDNLYNMFYSRWNLYRRAYKHKISLVIDEMLCDVYALADKYLLFPGKDDKKVTMTEATINYDMQAYSLLTDHIIPQITASCEPDLLPAKELIEKIQRRKLYRFIGQTLLSSSLNFTDHQVKSEVLEIIRQQQQNDDTRSFNPELSVAVKIVSWDYGMANENPIDRIKFYTKRQPDEGRSINKSDISLLLPQEFKERSVRVICKLNDPNICLLVEKCFQMWCDRYQLKKMCK